MDLLQIQMNLRNSDLDGSAMVAAVNKQTQQAKGVVLVVVSSKADLSAALLSVGCQVSFLSHQLYCIEYCY